MKIIKHILFILFFLIFFGEYIQNNYPLIRSEPLQGGIVIAPKPNLNLDNWLSGKYQDSLMTFFEQNLDLHPSLIRLHNQIGYSFFCEVNVNKVESGKDQLLFETGYISSYLGKDFNGDEIAINKVKKLAYIQTEFKKRNVDLLFVIAPGKASFFPDFLPSKYDVSKKTRSNYDAYIDQFDKQKINYIDFVKYFQKLKSSTKHPLFTRSGVHWSGYGATLAADTLFSYMEKLRSIDMPDFYSDGGEESFEPRGTDADISSGMNLLYKVPSFKMYYPKVVFKNVENKVKPNVLIIGDSFVWSWITFYDYMPKLFSDQSVFWYYNREAYFPLGQDQKSTNVSQLNLKEQLNNRDYILIIFNESNLDNCGYDFIEQTYELLQKENLN